MKFNTLFFLMLLICSLMPLSGNASSAGDDDSPPPGGGGSAGGGGGSPQYFDYYVPLIFSESSKYGESEVIIWTYTLFSSYHYIFARWFWSKCSSISRTYKINFHT